jgi:hypothetical protein
MKKVRTSITFDGGINSGFFSQNITKLYYWKRHYTVKRLFDTQPHIENNIESWIIEYAENMERMKN